jgi:predicted amidohydrolase
MKILKTAAVGVLLLGVASVRGGEPESFKLAALKLIPTQWDKAANFSKLEDYARRAAAAGASLVVTPEGYLEGYVGNTKFSEGLTMGKYLEAGESLDGRWITRACRLADELDIHLVLGFAERRGDRIFNTVALISPGGEIIGTYSKSHNSREIEPFNTDGSEFPVHATALGRIGMLVCYDRQLPETSRILAIKGAQIILVPAFGLGIEKINEDVMMRTRAYENSVYVAHVHPKNTFVVDPRGNIIAQAEGEHETMILADIALDERIGDGPIRDRRPEIYQELLRANEERQEVTP